LDQLWQAMGTGCLAAQQDAWRTLLAANEAILGEGVLPKAFDM